MQNLETILQEYTDSTNVVISWLEAEIKKPNVKKSERILAELAGRNNQIKRGLDELIENLKSHVKMCQTLNINPDKVMVSKYGEE